MDNEKHFVNPEPQTEAGTPVEIEYKGLVISYTLSSEPVYTYDGNFDPEETINGMGNEIMNLRFSDQSKSHWETLDSINQRSLPVWLVPIEASCVINKYVNIPGLGLKEEQFTLLHEIAHGNFGKESQRPRSEDQIAAYVAEERACDEFAAQAIKALREKGIDLEPEISDEDLTNLIEFNAQKRADDTLKMIKRYWSHRG